MNTFYAFSFNQSESQKNKITTFTDSVFSSFSAKTLFVLNCLFIVFIEFLKRIECSAGNAWRTLTNNFITENNLTGRLQHVSGFVVSGKPIYFPLNPCLIHLKK